MLNQADAVELKAEQGATHLGTEQEATHMALREAVQERCVALV